MRDLRPGIPLRQLLGWIAILSLWIGFVVWKRSALQQDAITHERFAVDVGIGTFHVLAIGGLALWNAWKARQPKPPPVYRSTILD